MKRRRLFLTSTSLFYPKTVSAPTIIPKQNDELRLLCTLLTRCDVKSSSKRANCQELARGLRVPALYDTDGDVLF